MQLVGLRLAGDGSVSAVTVSGASSLLRMVSCRVVDYSEVGVLIVGSAFLQRCTFLRCAKQAMEVREGGSLECNQVTVEDCLQGLAAYGGAERVVLRGCTILRSQKEGIMAAGTFQNASGHLQREARALTEGDSSKLEEGNSTSREAVAWGRARKTQLELRMSDCLIACCGNFGVTVDEGASAELIRCRLETNDPFSLFIKGGSDASVAACQFVYGGKSAKSMWSKQVCGGKALDLTAVQVGVNFHGVVELFGNAFAGPEKLALVEELNVATIKPAQLQHIRAMGMWSKPVSLKDCRYFPSAAGMTSVSELAAALSTVSMRSAKKAATTPLPLSALRRTCATFQQAAWAPTASE